MKQKSVNIDASLGEILYALQKVESTTFSTKLLEESEWSSNLSIEEIDALNEAYHKFSFLVPMLVLESNSSLSRLELWEQFLINEEPKKGLLRRAWDKLSGKKKRDSSWEKFKRDFEVDQAEKKSKEALAQANKGYEEDRNSSPAPEETTSASSSPAQDEEPTEQDDIEVDLEVACSSSELDTKILAALNKTKYNPSTYDRVKKRVLDSVKGAPSVKNLDLDALKRMIKDKNPKMRSGTIELFAKAVQPCFMSVDEEEKSETEKSEKKVEKLSNFEVKEIIDNVMKDMEAYTAAGKGTDFKMISVDQDTIKKLVKLLNDKGKLDYSQYNDDAEIIKKDVESIKKSKAAINNNSEKIVVDDDFINSVPNRNIIRNWVNEPELAGALHDLLGDNKKLPLYLLANRRALAEAIGLIHKHARRLLIEKKRNAESKLLTERWQKLAGLIRG